MRNEACKHCCFSTVLCLPPSANSLLPVDVAEAEAPAGNRDRGIQVCDCQYLWGWYGPSPFRHGPRTSLKEQRSRCHSTY